MSRPHSGVEREVGVAVLPLEPRRTHMILDWSTQACVPQIAECEGEECYDEQPGED
jgi:hypothetical protein